MCAVCVCVSLQLIYKFYLFSCNLIAHELHPVLTERGLPSSRTPLPLSSLVPHREALSILGQDKTFPGQSSHFPLFSNGKKDAINCKKAPKTCALIETFPEAAGCKRGEVRFSVVPPRTHVLPFVGLTNTRLQAVAGLEMEGKLRMRSGEEERFVLVVQLEQKTIVGWAS